MEEQLKLQVGKKYITRNGLITEPVKLDNNGTNYKFSAEVQEPEYLTPTVASWKANGRYLHNDINHKLDLLLEYQTAVAEG